MSLLCHQLGRVVVGNEDPTIEDVERTRLIALADSLIDKYQKERVRCDQSKSDLCSNHQSCKSNHGKSTLCDL
jgi:hypothetical protein